MATETISDVLTMQNGSSISSNSLISIDLNKPQFDQSTFKGRLRHFLQITDVRNLFITDKKLEEAKRILALHSTAGNPAVSTQEAEKLWNAKKIVSATLHPDTGEKIPLPFRLSSFVPINVIIASGMLVPNPTMASVAFWQWVNQSYNIGVNHSNRNASNEMSNSKVMKTYTAAVAISCAVALGLKHFVNKSNGFSPVARANIQRFVPYTAVAVAGIANVFMMRWNEIQEGIVVRDENGNEVGKSSIAGRNACSQVAVSRCLSSLPCLTIPPILMSIAERTRWYKPKYAFPLNLATITLMLFTGLPVAVSLFPQQVSINADKLESRFHNLRDSEGNRILRLNYNRGL
eukprot:TRINITY_DN1742_c0_g1_i1.p1 TRINITY_DN1742_c0_g1~~TRINITY_DN1742_c0_g1_i1.p1  ORF type:complete len:347 (-),score=117.98 TRINITY_DN1742_c0_g1_i1:30-1070(-)